MADVFWSLSFKYKQDIFKIFKTRKKQPKSFCESFIIRHIASMLLFLELQQVELLKFTLQTEQKHIDFMKSLKSYINQIGVAL